LTTCATLARRWTDFLAATHRIHHQHSDQEGDPHSPATASENMGWILTGKSMHHDTTTLARYVLIKTSFTYGSRNITMSP
jgi:stearoyl-CoA desaturase (delta-9 desaturase)